MRNLVGANVFNSFLTALSSLVVATISAHLLRERGWLELKLYINILMWVGVGITLKAI